jgi:hypothetical protein
VFHKELQLALKWGWDNNTKRDVKKIGHKSGVASNGGLGTGDAAAAM